jgi:hypothetical protein
MICRFLHDSVIKRFLQVLLFSPQHDDHDDRVDSTYVIKNGFGTADEDTIHLLKTIPTGFLLSC